MNIKLIASDLDGTLLTSDKKLTKENIKAVNRVMNLEIKVAVSTGRMFCSALPFAKQLNLDLPIIAYNGALIKETVSNNVIYECSLPKSIAVDVMKFAFDRGVYAQTYIDDKLLIRKKEQVSDFYAQIANVEYNEIGNDIFCLNKDPHEVLILTETDDENFNKRFIEDLKQNFGDSIYVTFSAKGFIEVMNSRINKWNGIKFMANSYGIDESEIMCIGDGNNDYEMIKKSNYGVAMSNAREEVKKVADFITESNDNNGVALIINKIIDNKCF